MNDTKPKQRRFQFSLRTAVILTLIVGSGLGGGIFWYHWANNATINVYNKTGKRLHVFAEWKSLDSRFVLSKEDTVLNPDSHRSFSFLPSYHEYVIGAVYYEIEGSDNRRTLLHRRTTRGERHGYEILSGGSSEYVPADFRAPKD